MSQPIVTLALHNSKYGQIRSNGACRHVLLVTKENIIISEEAIEEETERGSKHN